MCGTWTGFRKTLNGYTDGKWHHVVCVGKAGGANSDAQIYIDGSLANTEMIGSGNFIWSNTEPLRIGARGDGKYFNGLIDEVHIYEEILSEAKIRQLYAEGLEEHKSLVKN